VAAAAVVVQWWWGGGGSLALAQVIFNPTISVGVDMGQWLLLLFSSDGFYNPGLAFRREDTDEDNDNLQGRDEGEGTTMTTRTTLQWLGKSMVGWW
jgi:hypothetical protein